MLRYFENVVLKVLVHPSCLGPDLQTAVWNAVNAQIINAQQIFALRCTRVLAIKTQCSGHPLQVEMQCDYIQNILIPGDVLRVCITEVDHMGIQSEGMGCKVFMPHGLMPEPVQKRVDERWYMNNIRLALGQTQMIVQVLKSEMDGVVVGAPLLVGDGDGDNDSDGDGSGKTFSIPSKRKSVSD